MYDGASSAAINDEEKEAYLLGRKRVDRILDDTAQAALIQQQQQQQQASGVCSFTQHPLKC